MQGVELLSDLLRSGVEFRATEDQLLYRPAERVPEPRKRDLIRLRGELLPMVRVLTVLEAGPMKAGDLVRETGLDQGALYRALGTLYDAGHVETDVEGCYSRRTDVAAAMRSTLGVEDVPALSLDEFNRLGLAVEVRSEVFGERVLFAADAATVDPTERRPVYRVSELRRILEARLSPESLRELHRVKQTFGGRVTD